MKKITPILLSIAALFPCLDSSLFGAEALRDTALPSLNQDNAGEQAVISLSKEKWRWMSERKVEKLAALFHEKSVFVHMGGTMSRQQELEIIQSGVIQYKEVEVQECSVRFAGSTAIVLSKIRLVAVVGGNQVTNPFVVTEVYIPAEKGWSLASLSFTRLLQ